MAHLKMPKIAAWVHGPRQKRPVAAVVCTMGPWLYTPPHHPAYTYIATLGELRITKRARDKVYELYTPSDFLPITWGSLKAMKAKGEELWAARSQQDLKDLYVPREGSEVDVRISDQGSIMLVLPVTYEGREWIDENVDEDTQWFGESLIVEHRFASYLIGRMAEHGVRVGA